MADVKPYARPEIWRLAIFLHEQFGTNGGWPAADKFGWYDVALKTHNAVYRGCSPYVDHKIPIEAAVAAALGK